MLSERQKEVVVNKVNAEKDLPFISEETEGQLLTKMADIVNPELEPSLRAIIPDDMTDMIKIALAEKMDLAERQAAISGILVRRLAVPLTEAVNERVDMGLLPESVEGRVLERMVVKTIEEFVEWTVGELDEKMEETLHRSRGV